MAPMIFHPFKTVMQRRNYACNTLAFKLTQILCVPQAEMILYAALDPAVAGKAKKGDFVWWLDHFKLLQSPIN